MLGGRSTITSCLVAHIRMHAYVLAHAVLVGRALLKPARGYGYMTQRFVLAQAARSRCQPAAG